LHGRDSFKSLDVLTFTEKSKSKVKLNFGVSPNFSVQLKVSLSELQSERLSQKLKCPNVLNSTAGLAAMFLKTG